MTVPSHEEVKSVLADRDAMRKQAESTQSEYDRLSEEFQKLQVETISHCIFL